MFENATDSIGRRLWSRIDRKRSDHEPCLRNFGLNPAYGPNIRLA